MLKTALQHMPFGPQAHCGADKGTDKRAASAASVQKGSETKKKEGNLSRIGNNDGGIVGQSSRIVGPSQRERSPSAAKAHWLAPTKVLQPFN